MRWSARSKEGAFDRGFRGGRQPTGQGRALLLLHLSRVVEESRKRIAGEGSFGDPVVVALEVQLHLGVGFLLAGIVDAEILEIAAVAAGARIEDGDAPVALVLAARVGQADPDAHRAGNISASLEARKRFFKYNPPSYGFRDALARRRGLLAGLGPDVRNPIPTFRSAPRTPDGGSSALARRGARARLDCPQGGPPPPGAPPRSEPSGISWGTPDVRGASLARLRSVRRVLPARKAPGSPGPAAPERGGRRGDPLGR